MSEKPLSPPASLPFPEGGVSLASLLSRAGDTELRSLPHVVRGVLLAAQAPQASLKTLEDLVSLDPPLAARIVRAANAPCHGVRHRVVDLKQAVVLLGARRVLDLALQQKMVLLMGGVAEELRAFMSALWWYSVGVGDFSRAIYRSFHTSNGQGIYVAGLLHRLGILVLHTCLGERYRLLLQDTLLGAGELCALERSHLGFTHQELMERLAVDWGFPTVLAQTLSAYPHPLQAPEDCGRGARVLFLASRLMLENPEAQSLASLRLATDADELDAVLGRCGWKRSQLQPLLDEVWVGLEQMASAGVWDLA